MTRLTRYWKAILAACIPLAAVITEGYEAYDNGARDGTFNTADQVKLAIAVLLSLGVYAKANTPPAGEPSDPDMSETAGDVGAVDLVTVLVVVLLVIVILAVLGQI